MEKGKRISRIDAFAPTDLRAFIIQDTDIWALLQVINVHEWKAVRGDLKFDFIAEKTGWSTDKIGRVSQRAEDLGFIKRTNTGHGYIIEKTIAPMTWDEYHALEANKSNTAKIGIKHRENQDETPQKTITDAEKSNNSNIKNDIERNNEKNEGDSLKSLRKGIAIKTPQEFKNSSFGKIFMEAYKESMGIPYTAGWYDVNAWPTLANSDLSDEQVLSALGAFMSPQSWHRINGHTAFYQFVKALNKYATGSALSASKAKEQQASYYEPWDPRHPYYEKQDKDMLVKMRASHEARLGKWEPKPDWREGS